jgi:hypothetical protein
MSLDLWALTQDRVGAKVAEARAVATSGRPLMAGWLEQAAAWIGEVTPTWEQLTGSVPLQRTYRRLAASSHLEAWLICWPTDGHLQLHDHGGASGAFQVIEGELNERALVAGSASDTGLGATGVVLRDRLLPPGEVVAFDGFYIHDVYNLRPQAVTSVHIYGPAWRPMSFYRLEGGVVRTVGHGSRDGLGEAGIGVERRAGEAEILAAAGRSSSGPGWDRIRASAGGEARAATPHPSPPHPSPPSELSSSRE